MKFVCEIEETNSLAESFKFEWAIQQRFLKICSREFATTLNGGERFQIIVLQPAMNRNRRVGFYENNALEMCVGLRKTDKNTCGIKAVLLFEIRNDTGELYLKESMEKRFSEMNEEHFSDSFDCPSSSYHVRNRYGEVILFSRDSDIIIKGTIYFQYCREKKVSEPSCKNTSQLQSDLKDLLQNKIYSDVKFHIGDAVIPAHKNILCSRSAVFRKMFEQNMKEKEGNSVKIEDIEKTVFENFLLFLYTGIIQDRKLDTVMPLYSVANKYAVETLFNTCSIILVSYISDTTVAQILKLADMHNDTTLKTTAVAFICENFAAVEITDSWDTLLNSDPRLASYALKQVSITAAKNLAK